MTIHMSGVRADLGYLSYLIWDDHRGLPQSIRPDYLWVAKWPLGKDCRLTLVNIQIAT